MQVTGGSYVAEAAKLTQSCGGTIINKTHFYCKKLNSYEHLQICGGKCPQCPLVPLPVICGSHSDSSVGQWVKWFNKCDPLSTLYHSWGLVGSDKPLS